MTPKHVFLALLCLGLCNLGINKVASPGSALEQDQASSDDLNCHPRKMTSAPQLGRFSVVGATIFGPDGKPFVARGVNVNGYQWVWRRSTVADTDLIATCWKFNLVRVNCFLFRGESRYPQFDSNDDLDEIISTFTSRGIVVVIEAHDRIGHFYRGRDLDMLVAWYERLASRYRDNTYVWFDVMNEPGGDESPQIAHWLSMHRRVVSAIRDTARADNLILVEGLTWGQDTGRTGTDDVSDEDSAILGHGRELLQFGCRSYNNVAFSIHVYEKWNGKPERLERFLDAAARKELAVVVGEYGVDNGDNRSTISATTAMFAAAVPRGVGRVAWHWNGDPPNSLTENTNSGGGWEIDACRHPTNLTWMGRRIWNDNHDAPAHRLATD